MENWTHRSNVGFTLILTKTQENSYLKDITHKGKEKRWRDNSNKILEDGKQMDKQQ